MNNGLFRVEVEGAQGANEINVWLSTYGVSKNEIENFERKWSSLLKRLYPQVNL